MKYLIVILALLNVGCQPAYCSQSLDWYGKVAEITDPQFDVDYAEVIGVVKWEAPEFFDKSGKFGDAKGNFPWFLRKTDQERIQNLYGKLKQTHEDQNFVGTLKMDGSSIQVAYVDGERYDNKGIVICSRNLELKYHPELPLDEQGCFIKGATNSGLFDAAKQLHYMFGSYYSIQGELVGAGIQGNFEKFQDYTVFVYNIFDIEKQDYVNYADFYFMCNAVGIISVPEIYSPQKILKEPLHTILEMADGKGLKADYREGVVWREVKGTTSFKAISNKYLGKQD